MGEEKLNSQAELGARLMIQEHVKKELSKEERRAQDKEFKNKLKGTKTIIFQSEFVERMIGEGITQMKLGFDQLHYFFNDPSPDHKRHKKKTSNIKLVQSTWHIFVHELHQINHCLKDHTYKSLNSKHSACKKVALEGFRRLMSMEEDIKKENQRVGNNTTNQFLRECITILHNLHHSLHEDTAQKDREDLVEDYCE